MISILIEKTIYLLNKISNLDMTIYTDTCHIEMTKYE
jgi:hypothetical protein